MALARQRLSSNCDGSTFNAEDLVEMDRASNPTQWCILTQEETALTSPLCLVRGTIAGAYLYAVGFFAAGIGVAALRVWWSSHNKKKKRNQQRNIVQRWKQLLTAVRYPGLWMCLANLFFLPAVATATLMLLLHPRQTMPIDGALIGFGLLYFLDDIRDSGICGPAADRDAASRGNVKKIVYSSPNHNGLNHNHRNCSRPPPHGPHHRRNCLDRRLAEKWFGEGYVWRNRRRRDHFVERWGYLFDSYRSHQTAWFAVIEVTEAIAGGHCLASRYSERIAAALSVARWPSPQCTVRCTYGSCRSVPGWTECSLCWLRLVDRLGDCQSNARCPRCVVLADRRTNMVVGRLGRANGATFAELCMAVRVCCSLRAQPTCLSLCGPHKCSLEWNRR